MLQLLLKPNRVRIPNHGALAISVAVVANALNAVFVKEQRGFLGTAEFFLQGGIELFASATFADLVHDVRLVSFLIRLIEILAFRLKR